VRLILVHAQWMILELLRQPAYVVSTIAFPALFYVIFAVPESRETVSSNILLASFSCFAVFGVVFLQFGVGIAQERTKSWYYYLRTLPLNGPSLIMARFLSAMFFSVLSVAAIIVLAITLTKASMSIGEWFRFGFYLFIGGSSFCTMGLALGYWTNEKSSLPVGNLIYLPLSFVGGLWKPPSVLPDLVQKVSAYLPTRHFGEIMWATVQGQGFQGIHFMYILMYTMLFMFLAYLGFKKDFQQRFG